MQVHAPPAWRSHTPADLRREHWRRLAVEQAAAARELGYPAIGEAFERVGQLCQSLPIGKKGFGGTGRRAAVLELGRQGLHYRAIAARVGVSTTTARRWLREAGIGRLLTHAERSAIQSEALRRRWAARRG